VGSKGVQGPRVSMNHSSLTIMVTVALLVIYQLLYNIFRPVYTCNFCCDFRCDFLLLVDVNESKNDKC
jgi:hypothetical protein